MMKYFCVFLFLSFSLCCIAQKSNKHEKKEHIEKKLFPQNALELLNNTLPEKVKEVTFYKEQDSIKISYKTTLKYNKHKYSITFNKKGILKDIEVTVKQKCIPPKTLEKIKKHLYNKYSPFRIKKVQRQYNNMSTIDASTVIKNAFSNDQKSSYLYKVITEVKAKKERYFVNIIFAKNGDLSL